MIDIVELMRRGHVCDDKCRVMEAKSGCLCAEAADEIERLRAALREIASGKYSGLVLPSLPPQDPAVNRARAALEDNR